MMVCRWCGQPPHDEEPCTDEKPCRCCRMLDNPRAEAEVETLRARITEALVLLHHPTQVNDCPCLAHRVERTLRGDA